MGNMEKVEPLSEDDQIRAIAAFWFAMVDSGLRRQLMAGRTEIWEREIGIPRSILDLIREAIIEAGTCHKLVAQTLAWAWCPEPPCGKPPLSPCNMKQILNHMLEVARK